MSWFRPSALGLFFFCSGFAGFMRFSVKDFGFVGVSSVSEGVGSFRVCGGLGMWGSSFGRGSRVEVLGFFRV